MTRRTEPVSPADPDIALPRLRPFEEAEAALVRGVVQFPRWLPEQEEHGLRYALNLARLGRVRLPDGGDLDAEDLVRPWWAELGGRLEPFLRPGGLDRRAVVELAPAVVARARSVRRAVLAAAAGRLPAATLDREVCEKALVLVCGGGGGTAYVYLGGFALLEQYGLVPRLLAGASMGSILLLFRARRPRFDPDEIPRVARRLSFRKLFRFLDTESRYGLPGAMRLYLRAAIGELLRTGDGRFPTLGELAIPLVVSVTGIRTGAVPHDPAYYEHLLDLPGRLPRPSALKRLARDLVGSVTELLAQRDRFARLYLGADDETRAFDAIDAVGFSSSLPGIIHYDVLRDDPRMHGLLGELFRRHGLFRLVDGGIADNLPARAAWRLVQEGLVGTRNAFVLAFDGFAPKLGQPLWYSVGQLVAQGAAQSRPFVHHHKSFSKVLSPVELVPRRDRLEQAVQWGKEELLRDMPYVARMVRPFPALG